MFKPTLKQQELIDNHEEEITAMAKGMWGALNEVDFDPLHPQWNAFDDAVKDDFIAGASLAFVMMQPD